MRHDLKTIDDHIETNRLIKDPHSVALVARINDVIENTSQQEAIGSNEILLLRTMQIEFYIRKKKIEGDGDYFNDASKQAISGGTTDPNI